MNSWVVGHLSQILEPACWVSVGFANSGMGNLVGLGSPDPGIRALILGGYWVREPQGRGITVYISKFFSNALRSMENTGVDLKKGMSNIYLN